MVKRLAIVLGVVAVLAACGDSGGGADSGRDGDSDRDVPTSDMPAEVVAALGTKVVVLSSEDGAVKRTLAEGGEGISSVTVTPDRSTVYFTRVDPEAVCDQGAALQVMRVPFEGGTPEVFASGSHAVVSPDGRRIAFATGGPNQCGPPNLLAIQDLDSAAFSQQLLEGGDATVVPLGWSADSRRLLYGAGTTGEAPEVREVQPDGGAPPRPVALPPGSYLSAYLGSTGSLAVVQDDGRQTRLLEVDATTGKVRRTLFALYTPTAFRSLTADPTGRHLLFTTFTGGTGGERISRWSSGPQPVVLVETETGQTAEEAVWVPTG